MSDPATAAASQPTMLRRSIIASLSGTSLEWYDFFLYASAATLVFNSQFFPSYDPLTGTLLALGTYTVGFVARPLGGIVAGHYGDRFGRKNVLVATLLIMGGATFLIGLMPTYDQIGVAAPIALVVLRFAQGIGLGGEWAGGALVIAERSPTARRGYLTSFVQVGVPVGSLLSTGVLLLMGSMLSDAAFESWGWRVPFLLSAVIMLVGFYIRKRLNETPLYQKTAEEEPAKKRSTPVFEVLRHQSNDVGRVIGIRIGADILYYTMVTFLITYVTETLKMDQGVALRATVIAAIMQLVAYPAFAALSDRIGRRPVTMFGAIGALVWIMIFFALLDTKSPALITVAVMGGLFFHGAMYGVQSSWICELFGTQLRYSGASLGYQLSSLCGGSMAPLISVWLLGQFDSTIPIQAYVGIACVVTIVTVYLSRETRTVDLGTAHAKPSETLAGAGRPDPGQPSAPLK